jgi:hypothetical protein
LGKHFLVILSQGENVYKPENLLLQYHTGLTTRLFISITKVTPQNVSKDSPSVGMADGCTMCTEDKRE